MENNETKFEITVVVFRISPAEIIAGNCDFPHFRVVAILSTRLYIWIRSIEWISGADEQLGLWMNAENKENMDEAT
jgi:hypothetical protein